MEVPKFIMFAFLRTLLTPEIILSFERVLKKRKYIDLILSNFFFIESQKLFYLEK